MKSCPRPLCASLVGLALLLGASRAADSPYAGTWKVTVPNQRFELTFLVVKIDKAGQAVSPVTGLNQYARAEVSDVKGGDKALTFRVAAGRESLLVTAVPPGKDADVMLGSVQVHERVLPAWLRRTTVEELTPANSRRESPGLKDLEEAGKLTGEARRKRIDAVVAAHPPWPARSLALQLRLEEQLRQAKPEEVAATLAEYRDLAGRHGEPVPPSRPTSTCAPAGDRQGRQAVAIEAARQAARQVRPEHPVAVRMAAWLVLADALRVGGQEEGTKPVAEDLLKGAEEFIRAARAPEEVLGRTGSMATLLLGSRAGPVADRGLELARRAVKVVKPDSPVMHRAAAYRLLAAALEARGKADELEALGPTLAKIEDELDAAYEKEFVPFQVERVERRKGGSDRVVLVELFTNSLTPQVVAATVAFDAALKAFPPKDVAFLQYQVILPQADSLVFPDGDLRKAFYAADLEGLPAVFVDGKLTAPLGGARHRGKQSFEVVREAIDKALQAEPGARLELGVTRTGETVTAKAKVTGLTETGAKVRLRFALAEDRVRYDGRSGVRLHHHVVRAFVGGAGGQSLTRAEVTHSASINLAQLRRTLGEYLDGLAKKEGVPSPIKPLDLKKLRVIAWVQDEESKQVLGAAQAAVPAK
ncbi:MAG: hypothetical protein U0797_03660 [Gemmataceae bacterium]